ncbi:hypothetical protein [Paenibacillus sp. KN14-4R]|uniref:hypothetical protein n=1 Tax=Paenibacillus sp. KN14-4R TaxID=3445773 RepID=UPI003F9FA230
MLTDTDRKVLRVLFNRYGLAMTPLHLPVLCRLTQRTETQVIASIKRLGAESYITFDSVTRYARVIEPFERGEEAPKIAVPIRTNHGFYD